MERTAMATMSSRPTAPIVNATVQTIQIRMLSHSINLQLPTTAVSTATTTATTMETVPTITVVVR